MTAGPSIAPGTPIEDVGACLQSTKRQMEGAQHRGDCWERRGCSVYDIQPVGLT
ncbi:MAG: hypothetical protein ACK53Y_19085 [bacterium]